MLLKTHTVDTATIDAVDIATSNNVDIATGSHFNTHYSRSAGSVAHREVNEVQEAPGPAAQHVVREGFAALFSQAQSAGASGRRRLATDSPISVHRELHGLGRVLRPQRQLGRSRCGP